MVQSMSRKANCWDNVMMESFFKTLKVERVYQVRYVRVEHRHASLTWSTGLKASTILSACIRR